MYMRNFLRNSIFIKKLILTGEQDLTTENNNFDDIYFQKALFDICSTKPIQASLAKNVKKLSFFFLL